MRKLSRFIGLALLFAAARTVLTAQTLPAPAHVLRGTVSSRTGAPVTGASVFLLESLDATTTDEAGRFTLRTSASGQVTIVVRHIGFAPVSIVVPVDTSADLAITLLAQAATLAPIRVQAGAYTAGNERGVTLSALEVVTTPGATGDIARAIQTLPGVQGVDEGTGLFVRGGDVSETKVLLNNTVMLSPYNYETPTGNYTVTVNPFLLDGIFFSSGGFGARYGNILSGVVDLRTAGRPVQSSETAAIGLASVSTGADLSLSPTLGVHATATRNDTHLLFKVNGATRGYDPAPNGTDVSGSVVYNYRPTAEIKTFAIDRHSALGIGVDDPSYSGGYAADIHSSMVQAGWKDLFGSVAPTISMSYSTVHRGEEFGVFDLGDVERWSQIFGQVAWTAAERLTLRTGGDADWRDARFIGSIPVSVADGAPGAPIVTFDSRAAGDRTGEFTEADVRALDDLRLIAGLRSDYSSFTRRRTIDPRFSVAYQRGDATFTAAVGEYHQVSDPLYFASGIGTPGLGPMSARQFVLGMQLGEDKQLARVELYHKSYDDLVGLTHDKLVVGGGTGETNGADVFLRRQLWPFFSARATYSFLHARRTDPSTAVLTRSPFDITHSMTLVGEQALPAGWSVSGAWRYATGKPFTPVAGATFDPSRHVWEPAYGPANSQRMPAEEKLDLAVSRYLRLGSHNALVYYFSVDNVLDRTNLYEYAYTADYSRRIPVRSLFNRSFYLGASLTHLGG
ncbi:MAG TPA: TonB-dependent receptor [Gemmatimonadaceae bacterium]|nr:TonB-dependent receptor [Gemmatimonadaceae bacterium]